MKISRSKGCIRDYTEPSARRARGDSGSRGYKIQLTGIRRVNKPHAECKQLLWVSATPARGDGTSIHTINILSITSQTISLTSVFFFVVTVHVTTKHVHNTRETAE